MSEAARHPNAANLVKMARFDQLLLQGKVHQAYEVLAEVQADRPECYLVPAARGPDGPPKAA